MNYLNNDLVNILKEKTRYAIEKQNDIICRCPYCGDSIKHYNKGHLYISKVLGPIFHCVRCTASGPLFKLLQDLDLQPKKYIDFNNIPKDSNYQKRFSEDGPSYKVDEYKFPVLKSEEGFKPAYLRKRKVPKKLSSHIVWNVKQFLNINNINIPIQDNKFDYILSMWDKYGVGFLTYHGDGIVVRDAYPIKSKYDNRYLHLHWGNSDWFCINELTYTSVPTIVMAEGVFDVSSAYVHHHVDNSIWVASGKAYRNVFHWIRSQFYLPYPNVIIYADRDFVPYNAILNHIKKYSASVKVYIPSGGCKDVSENPEVDLYKES